jgi:putative flippase GtrA
MGDPHGHLARIARFGLAGLLNGAASFTVIGILDLGLHVAPELANAAGYMIGVLISYTLSKSFVFRSTERPAATGPRYALVVLAAFLLNQAVLRLALMVLGTGATQHAIAQLCGMSTYTVFSFLACQLWVFRRPPMERPSPAGDDGLV